EAAAVQLGGQPPAVRGEQAAVAAGGRAPHFAAGGRLEDADADMVDAERHPPAVRADGGVHARSPRHDAARLAGSVGVPDPAAGVRLHFVAVVHGLGDDPAVTAGGDLLVALVER